MGLAAAVLSGYALALLAPLVCRAGGRAAGWLLALLPAGLAVFFASLVGPVAAGETVAVAFPWVPSLGVALSFRADGLGLLFALLISGVGALVMVYAGGYLAGHPQLGRFYAFILAFMASMLGLVLADNLLLLFAFWELTGLTSFLLIGFDHERPAARAAATQALLVTGAGELAMLAGLVLLGQVGGSLELSQLLTRGAAVRGDWLYPAILLLVLAGAFTKSAQVPFHFWLPNAMEAPTPVSAYLHSATMVTAGVYLLGRLHPVLGGTPAWEASLTAAGAATMLVGAWLAVRHTDLKRILAYSTLSALGTLVLLLGLGTVTAVAAGVVFLLAHALYKGALFLVAGAIDHETGTRDVDRLGGLRRAMPITAAAAGLAALSMAGAPPLLGFIGKELAFEAELGTSVGAVLGGMAVVASILLVAAAGSVGVGPFTGPLRPSPKGDASPGRPHEAPVSLWLGPVILAAAGLLVGLLPALVDPLLDAAATAVLGRPVPVVLALWHGFNAVLALSVLTLAGGALAYARRGALRRAAAWADLGPRWGPARGYALGLAGLHALARGLTRRLQNGSLHHYLATIVVAMVGLEGVALAYRGPLLGAWRWPDATVYEVGLAALILLAALVAVFTTSRLGAVVALGVVGYGVTLIYLLFGAPDLAMTQVLIETLTVILFVLVVSFLPRFTVLSGARARIGDALVALAGGGLMTTLVLIASGIRFDPAIPDFYAEQSLPGGHGRNVVNVILVDFRGLDTLGEITVLSLAALGVYGLLKLRPPQDRPDKDRPARTSLGGRTERPVGSLILRTATGVLLPLLLLFSLFLLLRGHNEPGGGFAGGLVAAAAFTLLAIAAGVPVARRALRREPRLLIGAGLLVATASGEIGLLGEGPFLTGRWIDLVLPGGVPLALGTPLLFDLGVYLVVVGAVLTIVLNLAEQVEA
jgi:multicomponent Na+:H+ antiporter subunit A